MWVPIAAKYFTNIIMGRLFFKIKSPLQSPPSSWPGLPGIQSNFEMSQLGLNFNQTDSRLVTSQKLTKIFF